MSYQKKKKKREKMKFVTGSKKSKNMAILGDNLSSILALKEGAFSPKDSVSVDVIYIDPPYNVGGIQGYKNKWKGNSKKGHDWAGKSGAYLDFMEPRLKTSHSLLNEEGIIFVSICDSEYHRLKVLMDSVFGSQNYLGTIIWDKKVGAPTKHLVAVHEYIILYAKNARQAPLLKKDKPGVPLIIKEAHNLKKSGLLYKEAQKKFKKRINQLKASGKISSGEAYFNLLHPKTFRPFRGSSTGMQDKTRVPLEINLSHPITGKPCKLPEGGWKWSKSNLKNISEYSECILGNNFVLAGRICYGKDETTVPRYLRYLDEHLKQTPRSVLYVPCVGKRDLPSGLHFLTPKPIHLIKELISYYPKKDAVVLDYFAGSAATAHAVHELNKQDKGTRSWIIIEEMKSTFDEVIIPRIRHFDRDSDFGVYETESYLKPKNLEYEIQNELQAAPT